MSAVADLLANALDHHRAGRLEDAEALYRRATALDGGNADALHLLGVLRGQRGRHDEALELIRRATALVPAVADFHVSLGVVLKTLGRLDAARASYERALAVDPGHPDAHNNLGVVLAALGRPEEALGAYRRALDLRPAFPAAHNNAGNALLALARPDDAIASYWEALDQAPAYVEPHVNLGAALTATGRLDEAAASYRRALDLAPGHHEAHASLILALDLAPGTSAAGALAERRRWNDAHARPLAGGAVAHANDRTPDRPLRVGYVSSDFRRHSAASVFGPVILSHDPRVFTVVCYSGVTRPDDLTERFHAAARLWRDTPGVSDEDLARMIREDAIDVLVDLSGHTHASRLLVFARKPAPVQVTAWGYAAGTGLDAMDYFLADRVTVPPEARQHFTETVLELPSIVPYLPLDPSPEVAPLPALAGVQVTFGSFNRPGKLTDETLGWWAAIIGEVPRSRLLLKFPGLDQPAAQHRIVETLARYGIAPGRVMFMGASTQWEHLAAYRHVHLALDPHPHGGGVTALDSLWMGVPLVTLLGERVPSRLGASFLTTLGLADLVAASPEEYVTRAVALGRDLGRLRALRATLRGRMARSILLDHGTYCRAVEAAYRAMWRRWCATG